MSTITHPATKQKIHDLERLRAARASLEQARMAALKDFNEAMRQPPGAPPIVHADVAMARQAASDRFAAAARAFNASDIAAEPVDELLVAKAIDAAIAAQGREAQLAQPLHKVPDLAAYGLLPVGRTDAGTVWLCTCLAVIISDSGNTTIHLRETEMSDEDWAANWLGTGAASKPGPHLRAADYPLGPLLTLANNLGYARLCPLTEEQMASARALPAPAKPPGRLGEHTLLYYLTLLCSGIALGISILSFLR